MFLYLARMKHTGVKRLSSVTPRQTPARPKFFFSPPGDVWDTVGLRLPQLSKQLLLSCCGKMKKMLNRSLVCLPEKIIAWDGESLKTVYLHVKGVKEHVSSDQAIVVLIYVPLSNSFGSLGRMNYIVFWIGPVNER